MAEPPEFLNHIVNNARNPQWLSEHIQAIYTTLQAAIGRDEFVDDTLESFIKIFPYLLTINDLKPWYELLLSALKQAQTIREREYLIPIFEQLAEYRIVNSQYFTAKEAVANALEHAHIHKTHEMMLTAYIGLVKLQILRHGVEFTTDLVHDMDLLVRTIDNEELKAATYQALALAFNSRGASEEARRFGREAYWLWEKQNNTIQMARTAFIMATAARILKDLTGAQEYLEIADRLFADAVYERKTGILAYEKGILCYEFEDYAKARTLLEHALDCFTPYDRKFEIAATQHTLGIILVYQRQEYDQALAYLEAAREYWVTLANPYQIAHVYHVEGMLHTQQRNLTKACECFKQVKQELENVPDDVEFKAQLLAETETYQKEKGLHCM